MRTHYYINSNFRSIREAQTLSFEATEDNHLKDYFVVEKGKYRILKIATIILKLRKRKSRFHRSSFQWFCATIVSRWS